MKAQSIVIGLALLLETVNGNLPLNTYDRILQHGYPCENYTVTTQDGYLLTLFRIPDVFVLNGPNDGLPFMLASGGYDVWLGNVRGNIYSQRHISLSPTSEKFWTFSLDEIALIDLPTTIDYILAATNEQKLHYIGYSQGSTIFMMLQCAKPEYGQKIMTSHLMAPTVFMRHVRSPIFLYLVQLFGPPSEAANFLGTFPMQDLMGMIRILGWRMCHSPPTDVICLHLMQLIGGWDSPYLNRTLLPDFLLTTPADGSNLQIYQYLQFSLSSEFKAYDYRQQKNILKYGEPKPPAYNLENIQTNVPIEFYFADNDYLATTKDLLNLHDLIGEKGNWNRIKLKKFNHFDFSLAVNVKYCINNCILKKIEMSEGKIFNKTRCKCFRNKAF